MIPLRLAEIADIVHGRVCLPAGSQLTTGDAHALVVDGPVVTDSRAASVGSLYVARVGAQADGHDFVAFAASAGAVAALTTRAVPDLPSVVVDDVQVAFAALARAVVERIPDLTVIGVTGSSGKTTTKDLLAAVLDGHAETVATEGSLNSEVGVPLTVCRATPTTRHLVLEMGARGIGHISYLTDMTHPSVGVVLNVGSAHVGEFGSQDAIATAKSELVEALPPGGLAVLNADDARVAQMRPAAGVHLARTGRREDDAAAVRDGLTVWARDVVVGDDGAPAFTMCAHDGRAERVELSLLGEHQVDNALAVTAVALHTGMTLRAVATALRDARPVSRWRMEVHHRPDGVTVVNDAYNANPESMASALRTLHRMGGSRRTWAVLGAMLELGDRSDELHREVGRLARSLAVSEVVVVGEAARAIAAGADTFGTDDIGGPTRVRWVTDTDAAHALLEDHLREDDVVLLKSSRDAGLRHLGDRLTAGSTTPEVRS